MFFFGYEIFMIISSTRLARVPSYSKISICFKRVISVVTSILLALFVHYSMPHLFFFFSFFSFSPICAGSHWGKDHLYIAICEWSAVLLILIYNGSMSWEFQNEFVAELIFARPSTPSPLTPSSPATSSPSPSAVYMYPGEHPFVPYYPPHQLQQMYVPLPMVAEYRD